jgi:hypothetical protein
MERDGKEERKKKRKSIRDNKCIVEGVKSQCLCFD